MNNPRCRRRRFVRRAGAAILLLGIGAGIGGNSSAEDLPSDGNAPRREFIQILGPTGSICTFRRQGRLLAKVFLPRHNEVGVSMEGATIDLTASHADIVVTCILGRRLLASKVLAYGAQDWIADTPPCALPPDASEEMRRDCKTPAGVIVRQMGYPELVRMPIATRNVWP